MLFGKSIFRNPREPAATARPPPTGRPRDRKTDDATREGAPLGGCPSTTPSDLPPTKRRRETQEPFGGLVGGDSGALLARPARPRALIPSRNRQTADRRRTMAWESQPPGARTQAMAGEAREDLERAALDHESLCRAESTEAKYQTARNWWKRFAPVVGLGSHLLSFDPNSAAARMQVVSIARCFLQFTHRCGHTGPNGRPIDAGTSLT